MTGPRIERRGRTRIINPGAFHRAPRKTVATLDTTEDNLTLHDMMRAQQSGDLADG